MQSAVEGGPFGGNRNRHRTEKRQPETTADLTGTEGSNPAPSSSEPDANRTFAGALPVTAVWLIGLLLGFELISVGAAIAEDV